MPRVLLPEYVSYSLHIGKVIRSQVGPKSSHNELSAKEKAVREIRELFPDLASMLKSDQGTIEEQSRDNEDAIEGQGINLENILNSNSSERISVLP